MAGSCRTPIGKAPKNGCFKDLSAVDLLVPCLHSTFIRAGLGMNTPELDEVIMGQVAQSSDAPNIARVAALKAGIAQSIPAFTVQRNCGSGLQAITSAVQAMLAGDVGMILVGGTESMSNIPFVLRGTRDGWDYKPNRNTAPLLVDGLDEGLTDPVTKEMMGRTAENIAEKYEISREAQDEFAANSHKKAFIAARAGKFTSQIVPLQTKKGLVKNDEGINPACTKQTLAMPFIKTIFKENGTVTGGNACQISDGASSMLVLTEQKANELGIQPEAEVLGYAYAACDPSYMGLGPVHAIRKMFKDRVIGIDQVDIFEINEAFAVQALACQRDLKIPDDKLNLWGGAIALGHPVGATGSILTTKAIAMLKDMKKEFAVISMCIGGGQGGAMLIRNLA